MAGQYLFFVYPVRIAVDTGRGHSVLIDIFIVGMVSNSFVISEYFRSHLLSGSFTVALVWPFLLSQSLTDSLYQTCGRNYLHSLNILTLF
jgi:hypothetical protein